MDQTRNTISFEIEGDDVPDVEQVRVVIAVQTNRFGDRLCTMRFET